GVQQTLCQAFESLFGVPVAVTGCSRTDAGVHALSYICHADLQKPFDIQRLPAALNFHLPRSVRVKRAQVVEDTFHARYSAKNKTYRYLIQNAPYPSPFLENRAFWVSHPLDVGTMKEEASCFVGKHDFASFMASGSAIKSTVREVFEATVIPLSDTLLCFEITADGFLYNQVRIMAGTLLDRVNHRLPNTILQILAKKDRSLAGFTAPAYGLYLYKIAYI
ncbi:MAG TPA: tRNA pseudouridine(38-40) synthase TruA, partial [Clostridiales bacterium]|nr:tRNA pseudouridine(38-40) synthase TruA [Clostridiales bacterium]